VCKGKFILSFIHCTWIEK